MLQIIRANDPCALCWEECGRGCPCACHTPAIAVRKSPARVLPFSRRRPVNPWLVLDEPLTR